MIPVKGYEGQKLAVLGLSRSGLATARALRAGGAEALCWDDNPEARAVAEAEGFATPDLSRERNWDGVAGLVVSPGIPHLYPAPHPVVEQAWSRGVPVDNDIGLFFRSYSTPEWDYFDQRPRVVCVTGSNGKSTTSALLHHLLQTAGRATQLGGNIGRGVLDLEPASDGEVVVLELSSYQTELARMLQPDVAVFLNLSPDHLERHGGYGGYFAAKRRLFTQGAPERSVIGVDEVEGRYLANLMAADSGAAAPVISVSVKQRLKGAGWSVFARKGHLAEWRKGRQMAAIDLRDVAALQGRHNHQNACAAYAVARALGLAPKQIETGLRSFTGLAHRCRIVAQRDGVTFVNDSKATNADAAARALETFDNIHWILGGQAKAGGIAALAPLFGRVKKAYLIGEAAPMLAEQLGDVPHEISATLDAAVAAARAAAQTGDTVLLAPACASFDQFDSFEARGEAFEALVG